MSEIVTTGGAPAPASEAATQPGGEPAQAPVVETKTEPVSEPRESLAEVIRQAREARQAREVATQESTSWKTKYEEAQEQLKRFDKADLVMDPLGFAELHKLSPEEIALIGETYLYSLAPDRAPSDFRLRLMQMQQDRKERRAESSRKEADEKAQRDAAMQTMNNYVSMLEQRLTSTPAESFPDCAAWFGEDRENYVASLYHTANNMADEARANGKQADLRYEAVAAVLEADIASRYDRRRPRATPAPVEQTDGTQTKPTEGAAKQADGATSTATLGGNGTPRPPATTEAERIRRAIEHGFVTR